MIEMGNGTLKGFGGGSRKILMICYYFPPITDVGSLRSMHFAKYFNDYGWKPLVLTVSNPDRTYCAVGNEFPPEGVPVEYSPAMINPYKILGKIHGLATRIFNKFRFEPLRNHLYDLLCIPDLFWGWIPITTMRAIDMARRYDVDSIYVSCTPFSSAIIGALVKLKTKKTLVLDFRDPYALKERAEIFDVPSYRSKVDRRIERWLLRVADALVLTTEETRSGYTRQYPQFREKMHTVYNGFDMSDVPVIASDKYDKFTIIYTGDFYFYTKKNRLFAEAFFEGISILMERGAISPDNFQFIFYGDGVSEIERLANRYGVSDFVHASARIGRKDVIAAIKRSHFSLLRIVAPMISTKLFEGIALDTPFIATIPKGEAERIIRTYSPGSSIVTEPSAEAVAASIASGMEAYRNGDITKNDINGFSEKFSRERGAQNMMKVIDAAIAGYAQ